MKRGAVTVYTVIFLGVVIYIATAVMSFVATTEYRANVFKQEQTN